MDETANERVVGDERLFVGIDLSRVIVIAVSVVGKGQRLKHLHDLSVSVVYRSESYRVDSVSQSTRSSWNHKIIESTV